MDDIKNLYDLVTVLEDKIRELENKVDEHEQKLSWLKDKYGTPKWFDFL